MTTANLSVGLDTTKALESLNLLKVEMAKVHTNVNVAFDSSSINSEIERYFKQRTFRISLGSANLQNVGTEVAEHINAKVQAVFSKDRDLNWGAGKFASSLGTAVKQQLQHKDNSVWFDRDSLAKRVREAVAAGMVGHHVTIDQGALTAQTRAAGAGGTVAGAAVAAPATHAPVDTAALAAAVRQTLGPSLAEMNRAALAIAGAAKVTGIKRANGTGGESASEGYSYKDESGKTTRYARKLPNPEAALANITSGNQDAAAAKIALEEYKLGLKARREAFNLAEMEAAAQVKGGSVQAYEEYRAGLKARREAFNLAEREAAAQVRGGSVQAYDEYKAGLKARREAFVLAEKEAAAQAKGGSLQAYDEYKAGLASRREAFARAEKESAAQAKGESLQAYEEYKIGLKARREAFTLAEKQMAAQARGEALQAADEYKMALKARREAFTLAEKQMAAQARGEALQAADEYKMALKARREAFTSAEKQMAAQARGEALQASDEYKLALKARREAFTRAEKESAAQAKGESLQAYEEYKIGLKGRREAFTVAEKQMAAQARGETLQAADEYKMALKARREAFAVAEKQMTAQSRLDALNAEGGYQSALRARREALSKAEREHIAALRNVMASATMTARQAGYSNEYARAAGARAGIDMDPIAGARLVNNDALIAQAKNLENLRRVSAGVKPAVESATAAQQRMNAVMGEGHAAARGLAGSVGALWTTYGSIAPLIAFAAIGAGLRGIYQEGKKVEYQLAFVKGLSNETVTTQQFQAATAGSQFTPAQSAEGLRALAQSGLSAKESIAALPEVLRLATVGEMSVMDAAFAATGVLKAFGLQTGEIGRVSDVMAKAAAISNASVMDMMQSFKYASASASMYGVSLEETGAALAALSEKNVKGTMAGTAHMNLLRELYTPTRKASQAFKFLGLDMQEMQRQGKSSVDMIDAIRVKMASLDTAGRRAVTSAIGGERGNRELAPLLEGGTKKLKDFQDELLKAEGFTKSVMMELQNTVDGSEARLKQSLTFAFASAFEGAKGPIQAFNNTLAAAFSGDTFKNYAATAAQGLVSITRFLIEHAEAIRNAALAYVGLKVASAAATGVESLARTMILLTTALNSKTVAATAATTATVAATAATATNTVVTEANAVAQATAAGTLTRAAAGAGLVSRVMTGLAGPLGIILTVGTAVWSMWEIMTAKTNAAKDAQDAINNSISNSSRVLDQEIERLRQKKFLRDNPGKTEGQATVERTVKSQKQYVGDVESAYKSVIDNDRNRALNPGKGVRLDSFAITGPDGESRIFNAQEIKAEYARLGSVRRQIAVQEQKLEVVTAMETQEKADLGQASLRDWIEAQVATLEQRKANGKKVGNAIDILKSRLTATAMSQITDVKKADEVKKELLSVADTGGEKGVLPDAKAESAARQLEKAGVRDAIQDIRDKQAVEVQYLKFRKELDAAKYNPNLFGSEIGAYLAEQRAIEGTTASLKLQEDAVAKLRELQGRPHLNAADKENIETEIKREETKLKLGRQELQNQIEIAAAKSAERARQEAFDNTRLTSKHAVEESKELDKITLVYSVKVIDPGAAEAATAALAAQNRFAQDIQKSRDHIAETEAAIVAANERQSTLSGGEKAREAGTVEVLKENLALQESRLIVMEAQASSAAEIAAKTTLTLHAQAQTAEYGMAKFWAKYQSDAQSNADAVQGIMKKSTDGIADAFASMATSGKADFRGLVNSIIADVTRLMVNRAIMQLGNMLMGMGGGIGSGGNGNGGWSLGGQTYNNPSAYVAPVGSANGNIMTSAGPLELTKYANGGIARRPQLSLFGEGRQPEAYVPLPDGRTIPVTMAGGGGGVMNVIIENHGADVSQQKETGPNGEQQLRIIIREAVKQAHQAVAADLAGGTGMASTALKSRGVNMGNAALRRA